MKFITKTFLTLISVLVLLTGQLSLPVQAQTPTATITVLPQDTTVTVGDQVTVNVNISNASNLSSFEMDLAYEPTRLEFTGVTLGPFLASTGRTASQTPTTNESGILHFGAFSYGGSNGPSGNGTLAIATFTALSAGSSRLSLSNQALYQADLDATLQPSIVVNSSVTISGLASPAPSVTPRATPSPTPTPDTSPQPSVTPAPDETVLFLKVLLEGVLQQKPNDIFVNVVIREGNTTVATQIVRMRSDINGGYSNEISDPSKLVNVVLPGLYDFYINGPVHLTRKFADVPVDLGNNTLELTSTKLLAGDIIDNNTIDEGDYNRIVENFGCKTGQAAPSGKDCTLLNADLDFDEEVSVLDYGFLSANFNISGD